MKDKDGRIPYYKERELLAQTALKKRGKKTKDKDSIIPCIISGIISAAVTIAMHSSQR